MLPNFDRPGVIKTGDWTAGGIRASTDIPTLKCNEAGGYVGTAHFGFCGEEEAELPVFHTSEKITTITSTISTTGTTKAPTRTSSSSSTSTTTTGSTSEAPTSTSSTSEAPTSTGSTATEAAAPNTTPELEAITTNEAPSIY